CTADADGISGDLSDRRDAFAACVRTECGARSADTRRGARSAHDDLPDLHQPASGVVLEPLDRLTIDLALVEIPCRVVFEPGDPILSIKGQRTGHPVRGRSGAGSDLLAVASIIVRIGFAPAGDSAPHRGETAQ